MRGAAEAETVAGTVTEAGADAEAEGEKNAKKKQRRRAQAQTSTRTDQTTERQTEQEFETESARLEETQRTLRKGGSCGSGVGHVHIHAQWGLKKGCEHTRKQQREGKRIEESNAYRIEKDKRDRT